MQLLKFLTAKVNFMIKTKRKEKKKKKKKKEEDKFLTNFFPSSLFSKLIIY
jgi:hypothetical protein